VVAVVVVAVVVVAVVVVAVVVVAVVVVAVPLFVTIFNFYLYFAPAFIFVVCSTETDPRASQVLSIHS
jgi:hypothetical protein